MSTNSHKTSSYVWTHAMIKGWHNLSGLKIKYQNLNELDILNKKLLDRVNSWNFILSTIQTDYVCFVLTILKWLGVCTYKVLSLCKVINLLAVDIYVWKIAQNIWDCIYGYMGICFKRVSTYWQSPNCYWFFGLYHDNHAQITILFLDLCIFIPPHIKIYFVQ